MPGENKSTNNQERGDCKMDDGRKKIRVCLLAVVLMAITSGVLYYYFGQAKAAPQDDSTLVKRIEVEYYGG